VKGKDWTHEKIQLLTKGIVKFPPGTGDRWRVIAGFVGTKNQKEVIAKAKEIQEKQQELVEQKRLQEKAAKEKLDQIKKEAELRAKEQV